MSRTDLTDSTDTGFKRRTRNRLKVSGCGLVGAALVALVGCSDAQPDTALDGTGATVGAGAGVGAAGGAPGVGGATGVGSTGSGAAPGAGGAGSVTGTGGTGAGGSTGGGTAGAAGTGGGTMAGGMDHCVYGFPRDPRDAMLTGKPDKWVAQNGDVDLVLPKPVLEWMGERVWEESHDAWHNVRRCNGFFSSGICKDHPELVSPHQECADAEDGYQFLVMHRHMMQGLRQAFPSGGDLFEGFERFPFNPEDVPEEWRGRWKPWASNIIATAEKLEAIEQHLDEFPTEGDLGRYMQCGGLTSTSPTNSIHGALHFQWVVMSSPHSLGNQAVNIDNYMFWKLHGWIDKIWERYRVAKGLTPDEPKLQQALREQCQEMHRLGLVFDPSLADDPTAPLPAETGYFHEQVRPILENNCAGCHGPKSPEGNLILGGNVSSAKIVENLVNVTSVRGGQFKRVVPSQPDQSWLYLKASGKAANAGCTGAMCNGQVMPPTGGPVTLTTAELDILKKWIADGAPAPTQ